MKRASSKIRSVDKQQVGDASKYRRPSAKDTSKYRRPSAKDTSIEY